MLLERDTFSCVSVCCMTVSIGFMHVIHVQFFNHHEAILNELVRCIVFVQDFRICVFPMRHLTAEYLLAEI